MSLTQLGHKSPLPQHPDEAKLERIVIDNIAIRKSIVRFTSPEFTSLCPVTGQPDFAHIIIDYAPLNFLVESKSLKLFLASFRNHGAFHEDVTATIGMRFQKAAEPKWIRVVGIWFPRGGIPIDVIWTDGDPEGISIPQLKLPSYRGR